jgi:hypothetical protein
MNESRSYTTRSVPACNKRCHTLKNARKPSPAAQRPLNLYGQDDISLYAPMNHVLVNPPCLIQSPAKCMIRGTQRSNLASHRNVKAFQRHRSRCPITDSSFRS